MSAHHLKEAARIGSKMNRGQETESPSSPSNGEPKKKKKRKARKEISSEKSKEKKARQADSKKPPISDTASREEAFQYMTPELLQLHKEQLQKRKNLTKSPAQSASDKKITELMETIKPYASPEFQYDIMNACIDLPPLLACRKIYNSHVLQIAHDQIMNRYTYKKSQIIIVLEKVRATFRMI